MRIVISGGGIGGLTSALCLAQAGHHVHVLEQASEFSDVGAGLQCGANVLHVLDSIGISDALEKWAVKPERIDFRDFQSGQILHSMALGEDYVQRYGAEYWHCHRADLQACLLSAVNLHNDIKVSLNACVESYYESPQSVAVKLTNGHTIEGDCLIGADGVHSVIRTQLLGNTAPSFTGYLAWRGLVPVERLPSQWMDRVVTNFVGPGKHMVLYYVRGQRLANFVGVVECQEWQQESWVSQAPWQQLKDDFAGWHDSVETIINAVDKDQCYRWGLFKHSPFSNWSSKRVTLLGDAAHSTLPFMASGAAMAIEDARILQRSLAQEATVEQALQCYQRNRISRTAQIQKQSEQAGHLYHFKSSFMRKSAFTVLKLISSKKESFLPSYNANKVKLIP